MTTTIPISPNGAVGHVNAEWMAGLLHADALGRARLDLLRAAPSKARAQVAAWLARTPIPALATRARGLFARALGYLGAKLGWVLGLARTAGPVNITLLVLTTEHGRHGLARVLSGAAAVGSRVVRIVLAPFGFLARHTGRPGRAVRTFGVVMFCTMRDRVVMSYHATLDFFAARDTDPVMDALRTLATWSATVRLARRFIPSTWLRLVAYLAVLAVTPDTGDTRLIDRAVAAVQWPRKAAELPVGDSAAPAEPTVTTRRVGVVVNALDPTGGSSEQWRTRGGDYAPDPKATEIICQGPDGTPVPVRVHAMKDGSTVYQCGRHLYQGTLPEGVSHNEVAARIATAGKPSRDAWRFAERKAPRAQTA